MANVIQCGLYDYFEIACMKRAEVSLELFDGGSMTGVAIDLETRNGKEFLLLQTNTEKCSVNLTDIDFLVFAKTGERINIC